MILTGKPLDPSDGTSCQFELDEIVNVFKNDDVLYLWGNIPLVLSSITHPELTSAQARIRELEAALRQIANGEGYYGAQAKEYKDIARAALGE